MRFLIALFCLLTLEYVQCSTIVTNVNCTSAKIDLVFVVDSSGSIGGFYQTELDFVKMIAREFTISRDGNHAGVVIFSNSAEKSIGLNDFYDIDQFEKKVDQTRFISSGTRIDNGLNMARSLLSTEGRQGVEKLIVLLTDGVSGGTPQVVGQEIRKEGTNIVAIGITNGVNVAQITSIVGADNVYLASSFNVLASREFARKMKKQTCQTVYIVGPDGEQKIKFYNKTEAFDEARSYCAQEGAQLLVTGDKEMKDFITSNFGNTTTWIGGVYNQAQQQWYWVDGRKIEDSFWGTNPIPRGSNLCLTSSRSMTVTSCNQTLSFLCQRGVPKPDPPVLTTEIVNGRLRYVCKVNRKGFQYEVTWLQTLEDGSFQEVQTKHLVGDVAYLERSGNISLFSKKTKCQVRGWYSAKPNEKSAYGKSNVIFNGIQVQPSATSIKEGGNHKVTLRVHLTTPLTCKSNCSNCSIHVRFVSGNNLYFQPCFVILTNKAREYNVTVTTSTDLVDNGKTNIIVRPRITPICANEDWENHTMPFITIKRISVTGGRCISTGDPHIRTFDGVYFDHYRVGYYTLVESISRKFQVQVGTFKCGRVSCNCGVAVRENDDILVLDTCRSKLLVQSYYLSEKEPDENTFIEKKSPKDFRLRFNSGASVNFRLNKWGSTYYVNLDVQVPPSDYNSTKGLCGLMDKNKGNDMRDINGKSYSHCGGRMGCSSFTESWKLKPEDSLFYHTSNAPISCRSRTMNTQNSTESCPTAQRTKFSVSPRYKKIVSIAHLSCGKKKDGEGVSKEKNSTKDTDKTKIPIGNLTIPTFPTKSGVTEADATQYCTKNIKESKLYLVCQNSTVRGKINVDDFIQQCITDIQILDDKRVAFESAMSGVRSHCEEILERVNGSKVDKLEQVCPSGVRGECNLNGKCTNGVCKCFPGFSSDDCSTDKSEPPMLSGSNYYCDIRERNCYNDFFVAAFDIAGNLTCRSEVERPVKNRHTSSATAMGEEGAFCSYPSKNRVTLDTYSSKKTRVPYNQYKFDVSYDGQKFSQNFDSVFIYDSKCISCANGKCALKDNTCSINGYCFEKSEADPEYSNCKICDPARSTSALVYKETMTHADATQCKERYTIECHELHVTGYWEKDMFGAHAIKMHLNDPMCQKYDQNSTHFWITTRFDECGSTHNFTSNKIIQENTAYIRITRQFQKLVERHASYAYKMQCEFDRKFNTSTAHTVNSSTVLDGGDFIITGEADFNASLAMYTSKSFLIQKENPLVVTSYQPMYFGVKEKHNNKLFKFIVNQCYAKPKDDNQNIPYLFFDKRCPMDSSFKIISKSNDHFNFKVEAFNFIKLQKSIQIICELFICPVNATAPACTQECASRKRRSVNEQNRIEIIKLRTEVISFEVMETCKEKNCPANSKCLDLYPAECRCDDGYLYDIKENICSQKKELLYVNELHLDDIYVDTYSNESSIDFINMATKVEKELLSLLQRNNDDKIIGVKVVKARRGSIILELLLMYAENVTTNEAETAFRSALFNNTKDSKGGILNKVKQNIKPSVKVMGETKILSKYNNTLLILGILIPIIILLAVAYGALYVRWRRIQRKYTVDERGVDNTAIEADVVIEHKETVMD